MESVNAMIDLDTVLEFPCEFPIKVMGRKSDDFISVVEAIIRRNMTVHDVSAVTSKDSSGGTYQSVTVTITTHSKQQLHAIYRDLSACDRVLMTL